MAKLEVNSDFLIRQLFEDAAPIIWISGAEFDPVRRTVVLDIHGLDVPEVDAVAAIFTKQRLTVKFEPIEGTTP